MTTRKTAQRTAIRRIFEAAGRPLSPLELLGLAQAQGVSVSKATIYRTVQTFQKEGFLRAVPVPGQAERYELDDLDHHHHFCCTSCDRVFDVDGCPGKVEELAPDGFSVSSHDVLLYGECPTCVEASS